MTRVGGLPVFRGVERVVKMMKGFLEERDQKMSSKTALLELLEAASIGDKKLVKSIVKSNPEVINRRGNTSEEKYMRCTALLLSLMNRRFGVAKFLLEHGADPNIKSTGNRKIPCLLFVVGSLWKHLPTLRLLLEKGANPNVSDECGNYPLMGAVNFYIDSKSAESKKQVLLLLKHGADVDYSSNRLISIRELVEKTDDIPNDVLKLLLRPANRR